MSKGTHVQCQMLEILNFRSVNLMKRQVQQEGEGPSSLLDCEDMSSVC